MGGNESSPLISTGEHFARAHCGRHLPGRLRADAECVSGRPHTGGMDAMLAEMIEALLGRRVVLHDLLGSADFVRLRTKGDSSGPRWRYRYIQRSPFRIALSQHCIVSAPEYLSITTAGHLELCAGRRISLLMELAIDRSDVPSTDTVRKETGQSGPILLERDYGPVTFSEAAFSFDINPFFGCEGVLGLSGCGFLAFPDQAM